MYKNKKNQTHRGPALRHDMEASHGYGQHELDRNERMRRDFVMDEDYPRSRDYSRLKEEFHSDQDQHIGGSGSGQSGPFQRSFAKPSRETHIPWLGTHIGKGPKNYERSDERIQDEVSEALTLHPEIDASEIEVTVKDAIVTLSGTVESRQVKRLTEECIDSVLGVRDVHNELRIDTREYEDPNNPQ